MCACCRLDEWGFHFEVNCIEASDKTNAININRKPFGRCSKPEIQHYTSFCNIDRWMKRNAEIIARQMSPSRRIVCHLFLQNAERKKEFAKDFTSIVNDFCSFSGLWYLLSFFIYPFRKALNAQLVHSYSPTFALVELTIHTVCFFFVACAPFLFWWSSYF